MVGGEPAVGEVFGSYRVQGVLGRGGMAIVVLVRHVDLGTLHALKIPQIVGGGLLERFMQEGRLQARLRHPHIVAVTDVVRIGPLPGLVMEYVRGPNLRGLLDRFQPNLQQIDQIADQVMAAVEYAHSQQVVHRDIKPENVLLDTEGDAVVVKVSDFGLAKVVSEFLDQGRQHPTRTGQTMGTPAYMAPEQQSAASRADHRADIFSLGAVLYELVSGVPAFTGPSIVEVFTRSSAGLYRPLHELAPSAPERFGRAVRMALNPDRDQRPQSVAELRDLWRDGTEGPTGAWEPSHVSLLRTLAPATRDRTASILPPAQPSVTGSLNTGTDTTYADLGDLSVTPVPEGEPPKPKPWVIVAGVGVGLGIVLALFLGSLLDPPQPVATVAPPPVEPLAVPDAPVKPEPAAPAPEAAPLPQKPPRVEPKEEPPGEDPPAPVPVVEVLPPPPEAPPAGSARVAVTGVRRAWLVRADGERVEAGTWIPAGSYSLVVWFDEDKATSVLEIQLQPGEERSIACNRSVKVCR